MKKMKVVLAVAVAAVMVMAMSLTALAAPADVTISNEHAKTGDTVTVTVSTTDRGLNADVQVSGLEITGVSGGMSTEENVNLIADLGGSQSVYTCVVTAEEGQDYSFTLTNVEVSVEGSGLQSEADKTVSGTVEAAPAPSGDPSEPTQQPSEDPSEPTQQPSEPTGEPSAQPSDSQNADELDDVPKTGDATTDLWVLAVVGIAAAATVAVVAGKKVFSHK